MDIAYKLSVLGIRQTVLNRYLLPFSLGHCYLLDILESPYRFKNAGQATREDVDLCSFILSHNYYHAIDRITDGDYVANKIHSFQEDPSYWEFDLNAEDLKLRTHIEDFSSQPKRAESSQGKMLPMPWQLWVCYQLVSKMHFTDDYAWNLPLGQALCYYSCITFEAGDKSLITDVEADILDKVEEKKNQLIRKDGKRLLSDEEALSIANDSSNPLTQMLKKK